MSKFDSPWVKALNKRPGVTARGPRRPVYRPGPQLPDLGPHSSIPERMLAQAMTKRGITYIPQVAMAGGRNLPGGLVVDFILPDYRVYLRVQGAYWHGTAGQMARDDMQKVMLTASQGYRVVDIYTPDILRDPNLALDLSLGVLV